MTKRNQLLQVSFQMTNPLKHSAGTIGGHIQHHIEEIFEASIDKLSVRSGLPLGSRELPTGQVEPLLERLKFIQDLLQDADCAGEIGHDGNTALCELNLLIKDIEK